jgi:transcriptional regulator with XRE-family HTH domain
MTILTHSDPVMSEVVITRWTGRHAYALQRAYRKTNEQFAEQLGVARRTVARWHTDDPVFPRNEIQQILDLALAGASVAVKARFVELTRSDSEPNSAPEPAPAPTPVAPPVTAPVDPMVAQMAADMALMQARIDSLQEKLGALALRVLT